MHGIFMRNNPSCASEALTLHRKSFLLSYDSFVFDGLGILVLAAEFHQQMLCTCPLLFAFFWLHYLPCLTLRRHGLGGTPCLQRGQLDQNNKLSSLQWERTPQAEKSKKSRRHYIPQDIGAGITGAKLIGDCISTRPTTPLRGSAGMDLTCPHSLASCPTHSCLDRITKPTSHAS